MRGALRQRLMEVGITQKWLSLSFATWIKWNETREYVGKLVEHWKEEKEKTKAMDNSGSNDIGEGGVGGRLQPQLERAANEKLLDHGRGGVNWVVGTNWNIGEGLC